jgi:hypothetical protein
MGQSMLDNKKDFETIYNELIDVLGEVSDEEKLEVFSELLETGSVTLNNKPFISHVFSINTCNHTIENDEANEIDDAIYDAFEKHHDESIVDIDDMTDLNALEIIEEIDPDSCDTPDIEDLDEDDLLAAGINPDTLDPMTEEFIFNKVDDLIDNSKSFIEDEKDNRHVSQIWIEDVYALKYIKSILKYYFNKYQSDKEVSEHE